MKRILIFDDSPVVLAQLTDDFANDYEVVTAASGEMLSKSWKIRSEKGSVSAISST